MFHRSLTPICILLSPDNAVARMVSDDVCPAGHSRVTAVFALVALVAAAAQTYIPYPVSAGHLLLCALSRAASVMTECGRTFLRVKAGILQKL